MTQERKSVQMRKMVKKALKNSTGYEEEKKSPNKCAQFNE